MLYLIEWWRQLSLILTEPHYPAWKTEPQGETSQSRRRLLQVLKTLLAEVRSTEGSSDGTPAVPAAAVVPEAVRCGCRRGAVRVVDMDTPKRAPFRGLNGYTESVVFFF